MLVAVLIILGSAWSAYSILGNLPSPDRISQRNIAESTKIYDRTGKILLYEIHGEEKRTIISFAEIPDSIKQAALAAEDIHFYEHAGFDWKGIIRAALNDIRQGNTSQGGSTITQQLVKSSLLSSEKTFTRKIKELILSLLIERRYSKDDILTLYLNQIPYGSNAYGVESAAQTYFGKSVKDLTLAESATLAALPRAPTFYSPYGSHQDELYARRNWILDRMADAKFITSEEARAAKNSTLSFIPTKQSILAPHFVMYVKEYLDNKYGSDFVEQGGLKVTTTLDWDMQQQAEQIVKEGAAENQKIGAANAALVAINPKTGEILSMVGSKNYWGESEPAGCTHGVNCKFDPNVNITTRLRQPGSSFKPFVYATAFKKGYTPNTVLFDVLTEFNPACSSDGTQVSAGQYGACYHPRDFDSRFRGPVTLRQSLAKSLNIPSVKLLYLVGIPDTISTAQSMGITSLITPERYGLSLVLGGAEVSLLEMTSAFGIFSQDGILHPKVSILKVENSKGDVLEENTNFQSVPVLDTEVTRTMNDVLSDNDSRIPEFGARSSLYFADRQVAVKTGTTQEARDTWIVGYTPSLAVGVWAGNNDNSPMNKSALSTIVSGPMWHKFVEAALRSSPPENFIPPENKIPDKPVLRGLYRNGTVVKIDKVTKKLATQFTPPELTEEVSLGEVQSILAQIRKEDPLGSSPTNPHDDPQYKNWQAGINNWLGVHQLAPVSIPSDYDDAHSPDKAPKINFIIPDPNLSSFANIKTIEISAESAYPLKEISLFVNDELLDSKTSSEISQDNIFDLDKALSPGDYRIKIITYDTVGNKVTTERQITVTR